MCQWNRGRVAVKCWFSHWEGGFIRKMSTSTRQGCRWQNKLQPVFQILCWDNRELSQIQIITTDSNSTHFRETKMHRRRNVRSTRWESQKAVCSVNSRKKQLLERLTVQWDSDKQEKDRKTGKWAGQSKNSLKTYTTTVPSPRLLDKYLVWTRYWRIPKIKMKICCCRVLSRNNHSIHSLCGQSFTWLDSFTCVV